MNCKAFSHLSHTICQVRKTVLKMNFLVRNNTMSLDYPEKTSILVRHL